MADGALEDRADIEEIASAINARNGATICRLLLKYDYRSLPPQ
jgi:hypothetical protein